MNNAIRAIFGIAIVLCISVSVRALSTVGVPAGSVNQSDEEKWNDSRHLYGINKTEYIHAYDFSTNAGTDKWAFEGEVSGTPSTANDPTGAIGPYSNIRADDGTYETYVTSTNGKYAAQRFNFSIDDNEESWITKINVTWKHNLLGAMVVTPAAATTWGIYPSDSIQDAINAASDGDTVFVHAGTYYEPSGLRLYINKPNITLRGEGADVVTLDRGGGNSYIAIGVNGPPGYSDASASGCIVEGFRITNCTIGVCMYDKAPNCIIRNNVIEDIPTGVHTHAPKPSGNRIYLNNIVDNTESVVIGGSGTPTNIWNSTEPIGYTYNGNGNTYTNYIGEEEPAPTPATPLLISGSVRYDNRNPVMNPTATVTNLATSVDFTVKTDAGSNLYLTLTDSTQITAGDTIRINTSDSSASNETDHPVTASEIVTGWFVQEMTIESGELPDLIMTEKSEEWISLADKTYNVTYTVANIGTSNADASTTSIEIDGTVVATDPVPALVIGESHTSTLGPFTLSGENDTIRVCADSDDIISELNETNNCLSRTSVIIKRTDWHQFHYDIIQTGFSPSDEPDTNTTLWISDEISAIGGTSTVVADGKVFVGHPGSLFGYAGTFALDAFTGDVIWSYPEGGSSPAVADGIVFTIGGRVYAFYTPLPDLTVSAIETPARLRADVINPITATIENIGGTAAENFSVTLEVDSTAVDTVTVASVNASENTTVEFLWTPAITGNHTLTVIADTDGDVVESDETNNETSVTVNVLEKLTVTTNVRIEGKNDTVWCGTVTFSNSTVTTTDGVTHYLNEPTALGALDEANKSGGFGYVLVDYGWGLYMQEVAGEPPIGWDGWMYRVDYASPWVGVADFVLNITTPPTTPHKDVLWYFGAWTAPPLKIELDRTTVKVGEEFVANVTAYNDSTALFDPVDAAEVYVDGTFYGLTRADGTLTMSLATAGNYQTHADKGTWKDYTRSEKVDLNVTPPIRHQVLR